MPAMNLPDGLADFGIISKSIAPVGRIAASRIKSRLFVKIQLVVDSIKFDAIMSGSGVLILEKDARKGRKEPPFPATQKKPLAQQSCTKGFG